MTDEQTNETDTPGKEADPVSKEDAKEPVKEPVATTPLIDVAKAVAERIEKANKTYAELLDRQEKLESSKALGGEGGGAVPTETKEETPKEYNDRIEKEISEGKHDD